MKWDNSAKYRVSGGLLHKKGEAKNDLPESTHMKVL